MIFSSLHLRPNGTNHHYEVIQKDRLVCYYRGYLYSPRKKAGTESAKLLISQYLKKGKIDFNAFYGAYHFIIVDREKETSLFFGDNAGNCCFYYNTETGMISDSFLELSSSSSIIYPNYEAITEFIHFNCIYSDSTICKEVLRTDAMYCYELKNSHIERYSKDLMIWNDEFEYKSLHAFMEDTLYSAERVKMVDIITGGTDSRTILSHLVSLNSSFELAISGRPQMKDVQIAKEVSERLNKEINISDEEIIGANKALLRELFISTDGVTGTFSRYRLHKMILMIKRMGFQLEFGGVAGEFYKNSFLNQDFPFYKGKRINKEKFYKLKMNPSNFNLKFFTETMMKPYSTMEQRITSRLFDGEHGEKSKVYLRVGYKIIRNRVIAYSNYSNLITPTIQPLLELDMIKLPYNVSPWKLELNNWHRNEVSTYCRAISDIKTDRGLTLKNSKPAIIKEAVSSYLFLMKVGLKRILFKKKNNNVVRPEIYAKGRQLEEFKLSMDKCKQLGILNKHIDIEEIPDALADRLMTIGLVFMKFYSF